VPGVLHTLEHMGNEVFVHFSIGGVPMTARVPADQQHGLQDLPRGAAHTFHLQMAACHLFDADSGRNLLL
jgi:oligogalacturonide transport system ATP-binding protein